MQEFKVCIIVGFPGWKLQQGRSLSGLSSLGPNPTTQRYQRRGDEAEPRHKWGKGQRWSKVMFEVAQFTEVAFPRSWTQARTTSWDILPAGTALGSPSPPARLISSHIMLNESRMGRAYFISKNVLLSSYLVINNHFRRPR